MGLILRRLPLGEEDAGWRRDTDSRERLSFELDGVSGRSCCRSSSGSVSFSSGQREGEGEDHGQERAGEGAQAWPEPPSPAVLCHRQRQWVWGPDGYGAILLVNCDRDSVRSDDQDNCDRHVRCLQGEGAPGHRSAALPRVSPTRAALEAELAARGSAPGVP